MFVFKKLWNIYAVLLSILLICNLLVKINMTSVIYTIPNICIQAGLCTCRQVLYGVYPPPSHPPPPPQSVIYTIPNIIFVYKQGYAQVIRLSMGFTPHALHPHPPHSPSVIYTLPNICIQAGLYTCHQLFHEVHPTLPKRLDSILCKGTKFSTLF